MLLNLIHYIIVIFTFTIFLFPVSFLRYWFWLPLLLFFIWLMVGSCPITIQTHGKGQSFTYEIFKRINPNITRKQSDALNDFLIVTGLVLAAYKVIRCAEMKYPESCNNKWGYTLPTSLPSIEELKSSLNISRPF